MSNQNESQSDGTHANQAVPQNAPECPEIRKDADKSSHPADSELSANQLAAIELILSGASDTAVASELNINRKTIYRWRVLNDAFRHELNCRRRSVLDLHSDRIRVLLESAVGALAKQLRDAYNPTSHRAARTILAISRIGKYVDMSAVKEPDLKPLRVLPPPEDD
jgi:Helix-turn-helix domain